MDQEKRFIGEPIAVVFHDPPLLLKRPGCPDGFIWHDTQFEIVEKLAEWHDYRRKGKMAQNMRPEHLVRARLRGSWGVGRDYYRVRVGGDRVFELYYDRAPANVDDGVGSWVLATEVMRGR
jgi:hypothetical protein